MMGCDWDLGWNEKYEKAVEIYSVWGSSECSKENGNKFPLRHCKGEIAGRHIKDALAKKYRFGFVGGGDIHDGRPGDSLRYMLKDDIYAQGLTACWLPELNRENLFDAIASHKTYATNCNRIYLEVEQRVDTNTINIKTASEHGLEQIVAVYDGKETVLEKLDCHTKNLEQSYNLAGMEGYNSLYIRVEAGNNNTAWSSPDYK